MSNRAGRAATLCGLSAVALLGMSWGVSAAEDVVVKGVFALPDGKESVSGEMTLREVGPLAMDMRLVYFDKASGKQIFKYDVELTQQLHILATDDALSKLIHQHVESAGPDGVFSTRFEFPAGGLYHIYTDAVPSGYGQQVLRFDVRIGSDGTAVDQRSAEPRPNLVDGDFLTNLKDGYTVRLDVSELRAKQDSMVAISVEKDGAPAPDLTPYLGVSAHAVFIAADDLAYVHAHASPKNDRAEQSMPDSVHGGRGSADGGSTHDHSAAAPDNSPEQSDHQNHTATHEESQHHATEDEATSGHQDSHAGHGVASSADTVSPEMNLHVTPPAPGTYALWIEFMGGGRVHTIPFRVDIPADR